MKEEERGGYKDRQSKQVTTVYSEKELPRDDDRWKIRLHGHLSA